MYLCCIAVWTEHGRPVFFWWYWHRCEPWLLAV